MCERFTTSKLKDFEDLKAINTFGFRGEALASITHVARVTILTKTASSACAFKAKYSDGKLVPLKIGGKAEPKPMAGAVGTTITVEDLFYNMQTRRQAFKNSEEYLRILDVMTRYSIHYGDSKIAMTCKKSGQHIPDLHCPTNSSSKENIRITYGNSVARELMPVDFKLGYDDGEADAVATSTNNGGGGGGGGDDDDDDDDDEHHHQHEDSNSGRLIVSVKGLITSVNYSNRKAIYVFFINNRLVECAKMKDTIESVYADILPKYSHPFVYLSLTMPPNHLDVNVHPNKKEVQFLYEESLTG